MFSMSDRGKYRVTEVKPQNSMPELEIVVQIYNFVSLFKKKSSWYLSTEKA